MPPQFKSRSASVHEKLRRSILNGELPPGQRLVELKLCKQFGVSRTPIREAIRRLESEDLVQAIPGRHQDSRRLRPNPVD